MSTLTPLSAGYAPCPLLTPLLAGRPTHPSPLTRPPAAAQPCSFSPSLPKLSIARALALSLSRWVSMRNERSLEARLLRRVRAAPLLSAWKA